MRVRNCKQVVDLFHTLYRDISASEDRIRTVRWIKQISYYDPSRYIKSLLVRSLSL